MEEYESVLCVKNEVFVYRIPARTSNRGYRAAEWKLDEPDWTGRLKVSAKGQNLCLRLEDRNTGELFAQCPIESYPSAAVEQVLDSSRYFVVRIQDGGGRAAFIGLGFADRGDSFDLLVSIQDHFKHLRREEIVKEEASRGMAALSSGPKLDLGFKEGQTITINMPAKKLADGSDAAVTTSSKPRSRGTTASSGAGLLLPPPPGAGTRVSPGVKFPQPSLQSSQQPGTAFAAPQQPGTGFAAPAPVNSATGSDLLIDIGAFSSPQSSGTSSSSSDLFGSDWDRFTGAGIAASSAGNKPAVSADQNWVNFD